MFHSEDGCSTVAGYMLKMVLSLMVCIAVDIRMVQAREL
jgi:hypothetical protein